MNVREKAQYWLANVGDNELAGQLDELLSSQDESAIEDAFFQDLSFGTAGLRGVIGPGTNRMNIYTVGKATQGLADYINATCTRQNPAVAIARDSRNKGELFVRVAACVLAANDICAYLYPRIEPTPALSFAVRDLNCFSGICMTASHNPASYNGYKVYGSDGCQITSQAAQSISSHIEAIDPFSHVKTMDYEQAIESGLIQWIPDSTLDRYLAAVRSCSVEQETGRQSALSVAYTPLCGTGLECMQHILRSVGITNLTLVEAQSTPDGNFLTCTYPNPEERSALEEGIKTAKAISADLLLATDPDADRVGVALPHNGEYILPTGNEMGILLLNYLCERRSLQNTMPDNPVVVSTIVSTSMIDAIAQRYGVEVKRTLTGFKYIGDIITELESQGEHDRFVFGFEESYGYLSGAHVRDKDAINAGMLICQMVDYYKQSGKDLIDVLESLYETYGFYANRTINIAFPGAKGSESMKALMQKLRTTPLREIAGYSVKETHDYQPGFNNLPCADVFEVLLENDNKVIFRPSGTEPKIKVYLFAKSESSEQSQLMLDELEAAAKKIMQDG